MNRQRNENNNTENLESLIINSNNLASNENIIINEETEENMKIIIKKKNEYFKYHLRFIKRTLILESFHLTDKPVSFLFSILFLFINTLMTSFSLFLFNFSNNLKPEFYMFLILLIYFLITSLYVMIICLILSFLTKRNSLVYLNMSLTLTTHFPFILIWCFLLNDFSILIILLFQTFIFLYIFSHFLRFSSRMNFKNMIIKLLSFMFPIILYYNGIWLLFVNYTNSVNNIDMNLYRILSFFSRKNT